MLVDCVYCFYLYKFTSIGCGNKKYNSDTSCKIQTKSIKNEKNDGITLHNCAPRIHS